MITIFYPSFNTDSMFYLNFTKKIIFSTLLFFLSYLVESQTKAFPDAYGAGAYTSGGRGGVVVHVTNLNDKGTGSLREALQMREPRTIVFDVSGVITLSSMIYMSNSNSNVTIAGQTAPKGGITIDGHRVYAESVDNIIWRYMRFRGGITAEGLGYQKNDSFSATGNITNQIYDHCSFSWDGDETASWSKASGDYLIDKITVQRCILGEGDKGVIFGGLSEVKTGEMSIHHSLFYNISHRTPNVSGYNGAQIETVNNVVWTISHRLIQTNGNPEWNHINNYYDYGNTPINDNRLNMQSAIDSDPARIYTNGNKIIAKYTNSVLTNSVEELNTNNQLMHKYFQAAQGHDKGDQINANYFVENQHPLLGSKIPVQSADEAFSSVKRDVGCNASLNSDGSVSENKDVLDTNWLENVNKGLYVERSSSSSWIVPEISSVSRPSNYDTDKDGMADVWERNTFGDLSKDGKGDHDGDGYTDLEEFLNGVDGQDNTAPTPSIEVNAGEDQTICEEESVTLKATGASTYEWNTGEKTQSITVKPSKTTTYTVTGKDASGNSDTDTVIVTVQDLPTVDAGDDVSICEESSITLTATGTGDFEWSTGEKTKTITVSPNNTTTYAVTASNGTCSNSDEVKVTVSPRQTINAGSDVNIDLGESTKLSVSGTGSIKWSTGATTREITVSPTESTTYSVTVTQNGCESQDQVRVTVTVPQVEVDANAGDDQTICEGETATLIATGGSSYKWNTGATTASITVNPTSTTTYSVTVTEEGVTASDQVTVNVTALPTANAGSNKTIEQGESVTLSATGGTRYKWNTGATTKDITVSPNQTTNYTVEVFNEGDCSDSDQVRVTVTIPQIEVDANAGDDQTICEGETVTLTATGGSSYKWNTGETTGSITVNPNSTTTYSVAVSEEGVSASAEVTVNVMALPTANAGSNKTIEQGESVTLSATGGTRYKWNTGATTKDITVSPNQTTNYTVEVFNEGDCSDSDQVRVTVNATKFEVEADAGDDQIICEGETVTLTATGGSSYKWNTGATTSSITVNPNSTTTYSVAVTEEGVSANAEVTVNVTALPTANAGSNKTIEQGESVTLTATGGTRYKWNTGATTKDITVSPNQTTNYTVEVFNEGDCSESDEVRVTVTIPQVEVDANAGDDQTICEGETVTLTATGGSSYKWNTGATTASIKVNPNSTTTYSVEVSKEGVTASDQVTVNVTALPTANAGSNKTIEQGESVTLSATGGTRYKWNTGATTKDITVSPNQTTNYTVEVFNEGDCSDSDQVRVTVNATKFEVEADAGDDQIICEGETVTLTATGGSSYKWNTGETTSSITVNPKSTTTYSVAVSEEGVSANVEVTVNVTALPTANAGSNKTIEQGESVTLSATGGTRYKWNTGATTKDITVSPNQTTNYTVEVFNEGDCSDSDQVRVTVNATKFEVEADAGDDQIICEGETVTLTATGGSSYKWNTGETTASITVNPNSTTTYSVAVTEEGVSANAEVTVNVTALPTASAGSNKTIEQGESVTLSATGGTRYKWNTGATTKDITVSPNQTTNYTVEVFNEGDCSDSDQVRVTVNATKFEVEADAGEDQIICEGETVTLTATGGSSYKWNTGETTASITVNPKSTTTYSVAVSEEGVSANAEVTVNVTALPTANAGSNKTIEQGESVTLSATGGTRYKWNTGATTKDITVSPNQTTNYTVEVFNEGDCSDSDQVRVTVNATKFEVEADAGDDQTICEGETVTLTATGGSSYKWNTGATTSSITVNPNSTTTYSVAVTEEGVSASAEVTVNVTALPTANAGSDKTVEQGENVTLTASGGTNYIWSTGETTQSIVVNPNTTSTYSVEVFNTKGCSTSDEVKVTVNNTVVNADAGDNQTICEGETVTLTATGGSSYKWNTGETTASINVSPTSTTTYSVDVIENSVKAVANVTVTVNAMPEANAGNDQTIGEGESVVLYASGGSGYIWSSGETTQSITVSPNATTIYTVEVFNAGGCSTQDNVVVTVEAFKAEPEIETLDFEFSIYPNPATDVLNLKIAGLEEETPVRIFDMSGKLLYNQVILSNGSLIYNTLDVSGYPKGIYLITIERRGRPVTKKLILR